MLKTDNSIFTETEKNSIFNKKTQNKHIKQGNIIVK
jgi:hypothetical protein